MSTTEEHTDQKIAQQVQGTIETVSAAFNGIPDPTARARATGAMLEAVPDLQAGLREIRQAAVQELRAQGLSHAKVGELLGLSRGRAQQIAEGRTGGTKRKATAEDENP